MNYICLLVYACFFGHHMIGVSNVILFQYSEKARGYRVKYVAWKQVKADDWKIIQA